MSEKRSDRLRSIIAATVTAAAENAAPVTVTGAGIGTGGKTEFTLKTTPAQELERIPFRSPISESQPLEPLSDIAPGPEPRTLTQAPAQPASTASPTATISAAQRGTTGLKEARGDVRAMLRAPERPVKLPKWEKANVTLEPRDLAILQRSDAQARAYGFRIRKGGNPSLFVRAGLRLLDELVDRDPEGWIKRIAATTPLGTNAAE